VRITFVAVIDSRMQDLFSGRKPIPIQGTNVILDSPEVLEAWIAERKRRFPTSSRVEEKKRKLEEAVARGQLDPIDLGLRANKRRKPENQDISERLKGKNGKHEQRGGNYGKRVESDRVPDSGWGARRKTKESEVAPTKPVVPDFSSPPESDSDDDAPPELVSSKTAPPIELKPDTKDTDFFMEEDVKTIPAEKPVTENGKPRKSLLVQPKMPPRNPFASRPTLLRNVRYCTYFFSLSQLTLVFSYFFLKYE
jgi:hypothetical protein